MKLKFIQRYVAVLFLLTYLLGITPAKIVLAETNPNPYVTDCLNDNKDCEQDGESEVKPEKDSVETDLTSNKGSLGSSVGDYIGVLFALLFVIGLLYGLLKFMNRKNRLYDKNRVMKNMGGISLGQHKSVQLVVVGETYYLIGVGDDIHLLKEITDADEINRLTDFYEEDGKQHINSLLERLLEKFSGANKNNRTATDNKPVEFKNIFNTRLDEMKEERKRQIGRLTEKRRGEDE